jgi:sugar lactone lactonase YvrE
MRAAHRYTRYIAGFGCFSALAATSVACSSAGGSPHEEATGTASVAVTSAPSTVGCIEIDAAGVFSFTQRLDVTAGQSTVFSLSGLPVGNVDFTASAFDNACSDLGPAPTWISQSTPATIGTGAPANVTLELFPNAAANVGADFNGPSFRTVTTFAGTAGNLGSADGVGTSATFTRPQQLTFGGGHVYVADGRANIIRSIDVATANVTTIAGSASAPAGSADGTGTTASFNRPVGVAYDQGTQAVYVTDLGNCTIRKIDLTTDIVSTVAGTVGVCTAADGTGTAATFAYPYALASDGLGNLFVSDAGAATIRQISLATNVVTTIAGATNQAGTVDGTAATARFLGPTGLASDGSNLYILDGSSVRMLSPASSTGQVFTLAGDASVQGSADGYGNSARFSSGAEGIAFDGKSTLFITDFSNSDVRQFSLDTGLVTTIAGTVGVHGSADGFGPAAQFHFPIGVAVDSSGNVYVADAANATIRKM